MDISINEILLLRNFFPYLSSLSPSLSYLGVNVHIWRFVDIKAHVCMIFLLFILTLIKLITLLFALYSVSFWSVGGRVFVCLDISIFARTHKHTEDIILSHSVSHTPCKLQTYLSIWCRGCVM